MLFVSSKYLLVVFPPEFTWSEKFTKSCKSDIKYGSLSEVPLPFNSSLTIAIIALFILKGPKGPKIKLMARINNNITNILLKSL